MYTFYIQSFKTLASLCSWADRFESYLVANPEDWFSRDKALIKISVIWVCQFGLTLVQQNLKQIKSLSITFTMAYIRIDLMEQLLGPTADWHVTYKWSNIVFRKIVQKYQLSFALCSYLHTLHPNLQFVTANTWTTSSVTHSDVERLNRKSIKFWLPAPKYEI